MLVPFACEHIEAKAENPPQVVHRCPGWMKVRFTTSEWHKDNSSQICGITPWWSLSNESKSWFVLQSNIDEAYGNSRE